MRIIKYAIILLSTLILAWVLPSLSHLISDSPRHTPFVYYSSIDRAFIQNEYEKEELVRRNVKTGRTYNQMENDSILPMLFYRQLYSDNRLPDSIHGEPIPLRSIRDKAIFYRYDARDMNKPRIGIYTLFESMSGRVDLKQPEDFFFLDERIEFINPETNKINEEKSAQFQKQFDKLGFAFPARLVAGNPSSRKPYDEGYFIADSKDQVFHLKMVNGRPFLRNTHKPKHIKSLFISTLEPGDRSFYAFLFDKQNKTYIISSNNYEYIEIPTPAFNPNTDQLAVMGNMLYWNVIVNSSKGKEVLAIRTNTQEVVDSLELPYPPHKTNWIDVLYPCSLTFATSSSVYVSPRLHMGAWLSLICNMLFVGIWILIRKRKAKSITVMSVLWIALTGIYGLLSQLFFNR